MAITPKIFEQMTKLIAGSMSAGRYDVRLAENAEEVRAAQKLRYEVLYKESGGRITKEMLNVEREEDEWDEIAYHVVVLDRKNDHQVVGTIRLVSNASLSEDQLFYTEHAFNLDGLLNHYEKSVELSRACVSPEGRGGAILMLLWKFTMQFIEQNDFDVLFGCASFSGTETVNSVAIKDFTTKPGTGKDRGKVPTMLRGYLKVGARISEHAVIDPVFNTTFVVIYVDVKKMFKINHLLVNRSIDK